MEPAANPNVSLRAVSGEVPKRRGSDLWRGAMLSAEHQARYSWAAQAVAGLRVLDVGCGAGRGADILAGAGAQEVVGVDIAPEAISVAVERFGDVAAFTFGDLTALPFDSESFDVAVSFEVIEHVGDQVRALEELRRVLRPDGMLFASTSNPSPPADANAQQLTTCELAEELRRLFGHVRMIQQSDWFAVGLASNAALPELPLAVSVACHPEGPEAQLREHVLLQRELEQACTREKLLRREHDALSERLWQAEERNQVELTKAAADLDRARRTVLEMQGSVSWRITRPIRGVNGLFGRRSS